MYDQVFENLRALFLERNSIAIAQEIPRLLAQMYNNQYLYGKTFYHPLGFIYSKLHEFPDKESFRIHIWDRNYYSKKPAMDIHNHYYIVNSFIYRGCVRNNVYKVLVGVDDNFSVFEGSYTEKGDRILKKTERTMSLVLDYSDVHCAGDFYRILHEHIHSGYPESEGPTCTIVYAEKPGNPNPLVLGSIDAEEEHYYPIREVDPGVIDELFKGLIVKNDVNL